METDRRIVLVIVFKIFKNIKHSLALYCLVKPKNKQNFLLLKGTWQRGGFSGVFAEIGPA